MAGSLDEVPAEMIAERVRERYAAAAERVSSDTVVSGCGCGGGAGADCCGAAVTGELYEVGQLANLPAAALTSCSRRNASARPASPTAST